MLPAHKLIDGVTYSTSHRADILNSAKDICPRPSDIFICTYPKCGTTWIQHIVLQLLGKAEYDSPNASGENCKTMGEISPFIELREKETVEILADPRVLKSHFDFGNTPKDGGAKYIYAVRNPKDCLTSYFQHYRNIKPLNFENGEFDVFFELFMDGNVCYGDYFDHAQSWLNAIDKGKENILLLKYEDIITDLEGAVLKIAQFIGGTAAEAVKVPGRLNEIVDNSAFSSMKENQQRWVPPQIINPGRQFIRKGGSRDWKNHFTLEQSTRMDQKYATMTSGTEMEGWWKEEMEWESNDTRKG